MSNQSFRCAQVPAFLLCLLTCVRAQNPTSPVVVAETVSIQSSVLQETRTLYIVKPAGYEDQTEHYPVLNLLDGEDHIPYAAPIVRFLADSDRIPPMVVVGISSERPAKRTHDLTPPTQAEIENRFHPGNGGQAGIG